MKNTLEGIAFIGISEFASSARWMMWASKSPPLKEIDNHFEGKEVVNLNGDTVGEIENSIRVEEGDHAGTYALIDIDGLHFYCYSSVQRDEVGIPLDDLL
ncbi:MAG: hypothetical protein V7676_15755 [Parasphingorhabdus sp.]|uniref:hypothetical protein n=1 Tax=Parasphingorhabdus sp. TaxID=2709688 RepID=UPI00300337FF